MEYDVTEASELVAWFVEDVNPDLNARMSAAQEVLKALLKLDGPKMRWQLDPQDGESVQAIKSSVGDVKIVIEEAGEIHVYANSGKHEQVPLRFNPVAFLLESTKDDPRTQVPGAPPRKRSAVAEVVETAIGMIREQRK